ncbi:MAG: spermidine synthase [Candidatus Eisenbacteria sp.]|nr:spermidine synthase [Candidatus Eisenbacteria bacterium]
MDPTRQRTLRENTPWGELALQLRSGPEPSAALILDGMFLMDSESGVSERALAERGLDLLHRGRLGNTARGAAPWRVLLGGIGLGITLRALLAHPEVGFVQVVEIFPALLEWNRTHLGFLNGHSLDDPRVSCHAGDLLGFLADPLTFDLLLLDIDNGPTWLSLPSNASLYTAGGLDLIGASLAPGSVAVFWATERSPAFEDCLSSLPWGQWHREEVSWRPARGGREMTDVLYALIRKG